jgi:serine/threonine protein kinase
MPDPTDRQRAIFEFIRAFFTGNQRMPSLGEIGDEFGIASVNGVGHLGGPSRSSPGGIKSGSIFRPFASEPSVMNERLATGASESPGLSNRGDADETLAQPQPDETPAGPAFGPPSAPGEVGTLGPYRVLKLLGRGGMGAVYAALDTRLNRRLALKVMLPRYAADPSAKERFLREARAAAQITHDNVVTVYEADERDGVPYIAMQFLEGYPLDEYLRKKGSPSLPQIIRIGRETAAGLAAAHKLGLVHRDVKPGNLWLEAPHGRVKVLDFGLAKPLDAEVELTKSGAVVGTPAYMSPEQARGQKVDHRSDLFSLGAVLYRLGTGRLPFEGPTTMSVLMALGTEEPVPVRELNPAVPAPLAAVIHQLLAKKPGDRPASADEVVKRLRAIANGTAVAAPLAEPVPEARSVSAPMQVSALPEGNPFADIDVDDETEYEEDVTPAPRKRKPGRPWLWPAVGAAALAVIAAVVVIIIKNKDGSETKIQVPDGATVTVQGKDGKELAKVGPEDKAQPPGLWAELTPAAETDWAKFWVAYGPQEWRLKDGELSDAGRGRGWVGTKAEYTDFEVELEYKFGPKGNSGIFLRAWPEGEISGGQFIEVQLVDDAGHNTGLLNRTGAVFNRIEPKPRPTSKLGTWNAARVTVIGRHVAVTINGMKCIDADVDFPRAKGVIGLQQLDAPVAFRKVRVRDLSAAAADADRKAAGLVLSLGGTVRVNGQNQDLKAADELPKDRFTLTWVSLHDKAVTDTGLAHFEGCKGLTVLTLQRTPVTDAGLVYLKDCKGLTALGLNGTKVTDAGLVYLKDCKGLTSLALGGINVTDAGLAYFKGCKGLMVLDLSGTPVTDAGLAYFKDCKELTVLGLSGTKLTDAGLAYLKDCKGLTILEVRNTKVTAKGLVDFHAAVPGCKIEHDGGTIEPKKASLP